MIDSDTTHVPSHVSSSTSIQASGAFRHQATILLALSDRDFKVSPSPHCSFLTPFLEGTIMAHLVKFGGLDALKDDPFVDFTVKSNGKEWKVHKTTLCGSSDTLVYHCTKLKVCQSFSWENAPLLTGTRKPKRTH